MSHNTGTIQFPPSPIIIGPDTGDPPTTPPNTWLHGFTHIPAPMGTKLLMLHFINVNLPANNRLEVDLGYGTDVFTSADGPQFWTRPINIYVLSGGVVPVRYITDGATTGSVQIDRYGRGERLDGDPPNPSRPCDPGHPSFSNCDPFLGSSIYEEPIYDPYWYCDEPPTWENVASIPAGDIRAQVARSVGMIITVHGDVLSTCSVTLVDADKVITAGHCHTPAEALTGSVTFDYATDQFGQRPVGYNARFYKVVDVLQHSFSVSGSRDYALLQLETAPPGVPVTQLRHDRPFPGESVFGIHHPNGAVKKLSIPQPGFSAVQANSGMFIEVPSEVDVSGGSSGSGLFDLAGRIVGVLSYGNPCGHCSPASSLRYFSTEAFLEDIVPAPPPPITRDVMLVLDRSGSMSEDDGTGRTKIEVARDAASLFVQLVQAGTGNRVGLVSFSSAASSPADFAINNVTNTNKDTLIGTAPFSGGIVGALMPGGSTSIGNGLENARLQFPSPGANPRSILLLTDGMQNTDPMISEVEGDLGDIEAHVIGLGTESNLDGPLLSVLASGHSGRYMRAGNGLALEKFFSDAFGNIFESGVLFDPEFDLPEGQSGNPITFPVCGEETITAVAGWDHPDTSLHIEITTPTGNVITASTPGIEAATGRTWSFLKVPLPHGEARDGSWQVRVVRPEGHGEFPPPTPALRYFLNVIPKGGPRLLPSGDIQPRRRYYTGDFFGPLVMLRYDDGSWPHHADVKLTISRPDKSVGNILTESGLGSSTVQAGDVLSARHTALQAIENATGKPIVEYVETSLTLGGSASDTGGLFESGGIYGRALSDQLLVEGNYTLHAKATYGEECKGTRELTWSLSVEVGIDPDSTTVSSVPLGPQPDGTECLRLTFIPRDRYGNHLGPGRASDFEMAAQPGTSVSSGVTDVGNGSYEVDICWDPASGEPPQVGIKQPDRPTVVITSPDVRQFVYIVKFICGEQKDDCDGCSPVRHGQYATEINILNFHDREVRVRKHVIPLVFAAAASGREPKMVGPRARDIITLPPHTATMEDCCRISELLLGAKPASTQPLTMGFLEIVSLVELQVTAVYTASGPNSGSISIDVENIEAKRVSLARSVEG